MVDMAVREAAPGVVVVVVCANRLSDVIDCVALLDMGSGLLLVNGC